MNAPSESPPLPPKTEDGSYDPNCKVQVYFHWHRKVWSIKQHGKVVAHTRHIRLREAKFHVSRTGNARVRATGQKEVHAWVEGMPVEDLSYRSFWSGKISQVRYNPMRDARFHAGGYMISRAALVDMYCTDGGTAQVMAKELS